MSWALLLVLCLSLPALALPTPDDAFLIACAERAPSCASVWSAPTPATFSVPITTSQGTFTIFVNTSWAPAMAARFHVLSLLSYYSRGPFYRVLSRPTQQFVTQFGYRGSPAVDLAWLSRCTSNETSAVLLSNVRGTVAFGTSEVPNAHAPGSNCSAAQCSQGFSVELFINLADNAAKLDPMGFSPFGTVSEAGMAVVERVYAGYGECSDLCQQEPADAYCVPKAGGGGYAGVNLTRFLSQQGGWDYLRPAFPLLDSVL